MTKHAPVTTQQTPGCASFLRDLPPSGLARASLVSGMNAQQTATAAMATPVIAENPIALPKL
jgi:hypothetical protein